MPYDALLIVSFGGPEKPDDVTPFLENVTRGRNIPRERLLEVARHYHHFDGRSPINDQVRAMKARLEEHLDLPVYWGNRNWHPLLADTVRDMREAGVGRALALVTSAYSGYSSCRQYLENIGEARRAVANAPVIDKIPPFGLEEGFLDAVVERVREVEPASEAELVFTAHSIPETMAAGCSYERDLEEAAAKVSARVGCARWSLVYQSRSGPPQQKWLGPDIGEWLEARVAKDRSPVVVVPIGFLSDHLEVLWDLDREARQVAVSHGIPFQRAATVGTHPRFIAMIVEMVRRYQAEPPRPCLAGCCPAR